MSRNLLTVSFIVLLLVQSVSTYYLPPHYIYWYPQWRSVLEAIVRNDCSEELATYQRDQVNYTCVECNMTSCILDNWNEADKANMASAAVILGLLPTILSFAGSTTVETGILALRRPGLALLLAAGAPSVSPIRSFEYRSPVELLSKQPDSLDLPAIQGCSETVILMGQYVLATAAVGNLAHVSWQLGLYTVCSFSARTTYLPLLWAFIALAVHIVGAYAVTLRLGLRSANDKPDSSKAPMLPALRCIVQNEFTLCGSQTITRGARGTRLFFKKETILFVLASWVTSTGTILHIIMGTLILSGTLFISTQDALAVAARYLASAIVCRALVMFEISCMRNFISIEASATSIREQQ